MRVRIPFRPLTTWTAIAVLFVSFSRSLYAAPIRVRGVPEFQALRTQPTADGGYQVVGFLRGGFDQPLGGVAVSLLEPEGQPCEPGATTTGSQGEFCFRVRAATGATARLASIATDYLEEARGEVVLDPGRSHFRLTLEPETAEFDLSKAVHHVVVRLETGTGKEPFPVRVRVIDVAGSVDRARFERVASVAETRPAELELESSDLGGAGPVLLVADISVAGRELARTERKATLVDTIDLALEQPLEPVRPSQGFDVAIRAAGRGGPAGSGWVEANVGETQVGLGRIQDGQAIVSVRFQPGRRTQVPMSLRYVPEQPWYRAGERIETTLEILPLPLWAHAPWVALAAFAAFWIIRAWRRPGRRSEPTEGRDVATGEAEAVVLKRDRNAAAWTGFVVDAHTGLPVPNATLAIEVPSVTHVEVARETTSSTDGSFELLRVSPLPESARLLVRADFHTELRQSVPPLGQLKISLVERRRTVLQALTRWAKAMGRPWAAEREPTPAHVAEVASLHERPDTSSWAREVEHAAYGPETPSESTESALTSRTPPLDPRPPHKR
jgi:hypothetical protein